MGHPVEPVVGPRTAVSYGAPYVSNSSLPTTMSPVTYQVSRGADMEMPTFAAAPTTTYQVHAAPSPVTYTSAAPHVAHGGGISMPSVHAAPSPVTYTSAAPHVAHGGGISVPSVHAAPSQVTYTSAATAPATYVSNTTEIRGSSVSVAPAVYTVAPASPVVMRAPAPTVNYAAPAAPMGGGSISMQPHGCSVSVMPGSSVEVAPAVKYVGSSVSCPAAPAPVVSSPVAAPALRTAYAAPHKVQQFMSAPLVPQMQVAPRPCVAAPPVAAATVPQVTAVTAPPVTTATVMAPMQAKTYTTSTTGTFLANQQPGLVQSVANAAFQAMDQNHDGVVTRAEFNNAMGIVR